MSIKRIVKTSLLFITLLSLSSGCVKRKCGYFIELEVPSTEITSGSTVTITGNDGGKGLNMRYNWSIPDLTGITTTFGGGITTTSPNLTIEDFGPQDAGIYRVVVSPDNEVCGKTEAYIELKLAGQAPLSSPCLADIQANTFIEKYSNGTENVFPILGVINENQANDNFIITLGSTISGHEFRIYFDIPVPNYSGSYKLLNHWNNPITASGNDPAIEASIRYSDPGVTPGFYELVEGSPESIFYIKSENNTLIVSFCNVPFQGSVGSPNTMSGHAVIQV